MHVVIFWSNISANLSGKDIFKIKTSVTESNSRPGRILDFLHQRVGPGYFFNLKLRTLSSGANPTIASYTTSSLVRFEIKINFLLL
jgi:hypothetical protein